MSRPHGEAVMGEQQEPQLTPEELRYFRHLLEDGQQPPGPPPAGQPPRRRRVWLWAAVLAALVLAAAAALIVAGGIGGTPDPGSSGEPVPTGNPGGDDPSPPVEMGEVAQPADAAWTLVESPLIRTWLPEFPGIGPGNDDGTGWQRTTNGAVAAAWTYAKQITAATTADELRAVYESATTAPPELIEENVRLMGPFFAAPEAAEQRTQEPAAVRIDTASPDRVDMVFGVVHTQSGQISTLQAGYSVVWQDDDWKLLVTDDGTSGKNLGDWTIGDDFEPWGPNARPDGGG